MGLPRDESRWRTHLATEDGVSGSAQPQPVVASFMLLGVLHASTICATARDPFANATGQLGAAWGAITHAPPLGRRRAPKSALSLPLERQFLPHHFRATI